MATFKIKPGTSVTTTGAAEHAFTSDTSGADTLIVEAGAILRAEGAAARGAVLAATKPWKVTVAGEIVSAQSEGLVLSAGNSGSSTISVASDGIISGKEIGLVLKNSAAVTNAGTISGNTGIAFDGPGTHSVKNAAVINGNSGLAIVDNGGLSADTVENAGFIYGDVLLGGGNDTVLNTYVIQGSVDLGEGNDTLTNSNIIGPSTLARAMTA